MTTVLAFIVTLGILIVVHEYGHYKVARLCGVKVLRFSVGFGKVIWRKQKSPNDTEFALSAIPLGGYVKFLDEREGPVSAADLPHSFGRQPLWKRAAIVVAGPLANLLLAVLLYATTHVVGTSEAQAVLGTPMQGTLAESAGQRAGDKVVAMSQDGLQWNDVQSMSQLQWALTRSVVAGADLHLRVTGASGGLRSLRLSVGELGSKDLDAATLRRIGLGGVYRDPVVGKLEPQGPAEQSGLRPGDRVLSVDGSPVVDAAMLTQRIRASAEKTMQWVVERDGATRSIDLKPKGVSEDLKAGAQTIGRVGAFLGGPAQMVVVQHGPLDALAQGVQKTWDVSSMTVLTIGRMLIGEASVKNLTGPLTIADVAGRTVNVGFVAFLGFLALVSVSLGVLNLLPLPMLDGGHLMYYLFEAVTGRPVSDAWLDRLQRGGMAVLLLMMVVALSNDVLRLMGR
jgi:regulator of sigma E protease